MRIISYGDLYIDYYFRNNVLIGVCGGNIGCNILANLANSYETSIIGITGKDIQGNICIDSLNRLGVNTSQVKMLNTKTNIAFINRNGMNTTCPYCSRDLSYEDSLYDVDYVKSNIMEDDIIIVDSVDEKSLEVIENMNNRKFLYLHYLDNLMYLPLDEIVSLLSDKFELIQISSKVYNILKEKFKIDSMDLYELLNPKMLIIYKQEKGADIIYNNVLENKEFEENINIVDNSGSGEAFFSEFVKGSLKYEEWNEKNVSLTYMKASSSSRFILLNYGARIHLEPMYKINTYKECICKDIEL